MMKNQKNGKKMKNKLPKWFNGEHYSHGDTVNNPFSGEEYYLNRTELSMYDFIKGAEYTLMIAQQQIFDGKIEKSPEWSQKLVDDFDKGRDWFRKANPEAYMTLLD